MRSSGAGGPGPHHGVEHPELRENPREERGAHHDFPSELPGHRRRRPSLAGIAADTVLELPGHLLQRRQELARELVAKAQNGAREPVLPADGNDARGQTVPRCRGLRAALLLDPHRRAAEEEVAHRHVPSADDVDDLVERQGGIAQRFEVAPSGHRLAPAPALEIVVDDVELAVLAEPGGEELLEHEHAQHVPVFVRKHLERVFGQVEAVGDGFEVRLEELALQRFPFAARRPLDEVLRRSVDAGNAHGGMAWRVLCRGCTENSGRRKTGQREASAASRTSCVDFPGIPGNAARAFATAGSLSSGPEGTASRRRASRSLSERVSAIASSPQFRPRPDGRPPLLAAASTVASSDSAPAVAMVHPAPMNDDRANNRIDEAVFALLYQGIFEHHPVMGARSWNAFNWATMGRLHDKGLISNPREQGQVGVAHRNRSA